jgi:hypothetical protein
MLDPRDTLLTGILNLLVQCHVQVFKIADVFEHVVDHVVRPSAGPVGYLMIDLLPDSHAKLLLQHGLEVVRLPEIGFTGLGCSCLGLVAVRKLRLEHRVLKVPGNWQAIIARTKLDHPHRVELQIVPNFSRIRIRVDFRPPVGSSRKMKFFPPVRTMTAPMAASSVLWG